MDKNIILNGKVTVPAEFRPTANYTYPSYCTHMMVEQAYFENYVNATGKRIYLPVFWTNYYVMNGYEKGDHSRLNDFLRSLPKDVQYYTIVQYDDGVMCKDHGLDLLTFAAGGIGDIPIPLLPSHFPMQYNPNKTKLCNFMGNVNNHPIRKQRIEGVDYFEGLNHIQYFEKLNEYKYTLATRGYGKTSFRLYEALAMRSIPIYLSDEHWLPYGMEINWNEISCLATTPQEVIDHLSATDEASEAYRKAAINAYFDRYFTMSGVISWIKQYLRNE